MSPDLRALCSTAGLSIEEGDSHIAEFKDGRKHEVYFDEVSADTLRVWGFVAKKQVVESVPRVAITAWQRNRGTRLVGFHIDSRQRLVGSARLPREGLEADELEVYVRAVAVECDRFEYLLTGRDSY
ncbi:MAG: hypothetical protein RJA70_2665 [Pseudomonadota bacterium]